MQEKGLGYVGLATARTGLECNHECETITSIYNLVCVGTQGFHILLQCSQSIPKVWKSFCVFTHTSVVVSLSNYFHLMKFL